MEIISKLNLNCVLGEIFCLSKLVEFEIIYFSLNLYFSLIEDNTVSLKELAGRSHSKV